jgi:MFS family permease
MVLGLAAGQSEALVPMITQEIFFLHERGRYLMIQQTIQTIATAIFVLFASPIASSITPQWWYGLGAILSGVSFIIGFFFVPETKYNRPLSSYQESGGSESKAGDDNSNSDDSALELCIKRPELDFEKYEARSFRSDLRLWIGKPEWRKAWETLYVSFEL